MTPVDDRSHALDLVDALEFGEETLAEFFPDTSELPLAEASPAGHVAAAAHFLGQVFPGEAGVEDEEDAGEALAVIDPFAFGVVDAAWFGRWQQRVNTFPQGIREQWLGHDRTSSTAWFALNERRDALTRIPLVRASKDFIEETLLLIWQQCPNTNSVGAFTIWRSPPRRLRIKSRVRPHIERKDPDSVCIRVILKLLR
jgi:hypothetical protein